MQECYRDASSKPQNTFSYIVNTFFLYLYVSLLDYVLVSFPFLFLLWYFRFLSLLCALVYIIHCGQSFWQCKYIFTLHKSDSASEPSFLHPFTDSPFLQRRAGGLVFTSTKKKKTAPAGEVDRKIIPGARDSLM